MSKYTIDADGQSLTKDQLMTMLANQEYPQTLSIVGIVTEDDPESQSWVFKKAADGQGYSYDQEEVVTNGLPAVAGTEFVSMANFVEFVENCIAYFGPDESELNSMNDDIDDILFSNNAAVNNLNGMHRAEGNAAGSSGNNAAGSSGNNAAGSFVGGRRRRNVTRRRSQRRKVSRRRSQRRKVTRRRRASQRRRY
jgi:hypothetical protein